MRFMNSVRQSGIACCLVLTSPIITSSSSSFIISPAHRSSSSSSSRRRTFVHYPTQQSRHLSSALPSATTTISFLTDIEGDLHYLKQFVKTSKVLTLNEAEDEIHFIDSDDGSSSNESYPSMFVMGGDVVDKGGSDIQVLKLLVDFKKRYGDRVQFILGNRDINKLRFIQELNVPFELSSEESTYSSIEEYNHPLFEHGGLFWFNNTGLVGDPSLEPSSGIATDAAERVKWMLKNSMGSPQAFEFRKNELQALAVDSTYDNISDSDVVESFRRICLPPNLKLQKQNQFRVRDASLIYEYLKLGKIAFLYGDILFLHGALPIEHMFKDSSHTANANNEYYFNEILPFLKDDCSRVPTLSKYVDVLNQLKDIELEDFVQQVLSRNIGKESISATNGGYADYHFDINGKLQKAQNLNGNTTEGGGGRSLIQFGMRSLPSRSPNPTCVYGSNIENGMPKILHMEEKYSKLSSLLKRNGVCCVVSGHQPHGDASLCIKSTAADTEENVFYISGDTSYSNDTVWIHQPKQIPPLNQQQEYSGRSINKNRGAAVSELLFYLENISNSKDDNSSTPHINSCISHGQLSNSVKYESCNMIENDPYVGRKVVLSKSFMQKVVEDSDSDSLQRLQDENIFWVKAKLNIKNEKKQSYLLAKGKGWEVTHLTVPIEEMDRAIEFM